MSAYRFCRTDDIPLLVDALNRCWHPDHPGEPLMTVAGFKREIRDVQIWCSSCMVAFAGSEPVGILTGAKRAGVTLVHRIAVHPDHRRKGHGRHLLTSLGSKLAILGPPRIVAEVPRDAPAADELFAACGFSRDASYTDFVLDRPPAGNASRETLAGRLLIPVTIDDLVANGLMADSDPRFCWERAVDTLIARKDEIAGLAVATEERIEAYLLYTSNDSAGTSIVALRSVVDDADVRGPRLLLSRLIDQARAPFSIRKVHPEEIPAALLQDLGFRCDETYTRYAATARAA